MSIAQTPLQNGRLITFSEKEHTYTDDLGNLYTSTTTLIHKYVKPFDTDFWAEKKAKDLGKSAEEVKQMWKDITKEACDNGNEKHNYLEDSINISTGYIKKKEVNGKFEMYTIDDILANPNLGLVDEIELIGCGLAERYPKIFEVVHYLYSVGYRFYAEVCVYSYKHLVSGAIDLLAIKFDEDFKPVDGYILDWKTNKNKIRNVAGYYQKDNKGNYTGNFITTKEKMLFPLNHLAHCSGSTYGLQLNTYATMCELRGFPINRCILFHIRSKDQIALTEKRDIEGEEEVEVIKLPDMRKDVSLMFAHHYQTRLKSRDVQIKIGL